METVHRDFAPKGVKFYYIYKALAHPANNGYVTPFNLQERLMHVAEAKRTLFGSKIEWICDSMDNDLKHALGDRPNSEFIVDPQGKIVVSRGWSKPTELRADLEKLVGPVDDPTSIAELGMKQLPPPERAQTGIVKPVELPGQMSPLKIMPLESKSPFYAKLRAESGGGKMYLGFFLDPLYKVHWNNKAPAIELTIEPPAGVSVTPDRGEGPKVNVDADADPREFLVEVSGRSSDPLKITVKYFACDDAETFCVPVTQQYLVSFDRDRDGGSRRSFGSRGPAAQRPDGRPSMADRMRGNPVMSALDANGDGKLSAKELAAAPRSLRKLDADGDGDLGADELWTAGGSPSADRQPPGGQRSGMMQMFLQNDSNNDGRLTGKEIPEPMRRRMSQMDTDNDGSISRAEMQAMMSRRGGPVGDRTRPAERRPPR